MLPSGIPRLRKSVGRAWRTSRVTERLAKLRIVEWYEVFRLVSRG